MMSALWSHYFWDVWFPLDLIYFFHFWGENFDWFMQFFWKRFYLWNLNLEIWNLKFGIWNLRFWKLKLWNFNLVTYDFFLIQLITYDHDLNFYYNKKHTTGKGNQGAFFTSEPKLWRPRGFSTSILTKGNQGAFLSWILMKGNQGVFLPRNRSYGDQGAFLPRSWRKVTNELFCLRTRVVTTKGLFYLELDER